MPVSQSGSTFFLTKIFHQAGKYSQILKPFVSITPSKTLKVPKREIFDRSDFPDFFTIKSSWVGDLVVKILTYYFNF